MQKKQNRIETSCLIFSPIRVVWRPRRHEVHLTSADHPQSILRYWLQILRKRLE